MLRYGSAVWHETLLVAGSQSWIDNGPGNDRLARVECRPPQGWAESFLVFALKAVADVLDAAQREVVQGIRNRLQVPLRQMQVQSGSLQVAITK